MNSKLNILFPIFMVIALVSFAWAAMIPGYQQVETDIIFSHAFHVDDQDIECDACHLEIESSTLASDRNLPTMDECAACHDIEDDETCDMCHKNSEEPGIGADPTRELLFSHEKHMNAELACNDCHAQVVTSDSISVGNYPDMKQCNSCHETCNKQSGCSACHNSGIDVSDIHPVGWRNEHADRANIEPQWCEQCHLKNDFCVSCHRGDNLTGSIHDLNYIFTHALDAKSDQVSCARCHDNKQFCVSCHQSGLRMPLNHSSLNWRANHGSAARTDVENCNACHDSADPTCARVGCHNDFDDVIGTDYPIHKDDLSIFDGQGAWHDDYGMYCFQCHRADKTNPVGFCNDYCHSNNGGGN